ncbi:hypothetical protein ROHU_021925 [Labeo rohita]|uniref:Uncharacterized protein n=1 Tax=Labeo rohita TaxID=84645 RepID=A0A498N7A7_LABRO|nr:hypothetical protein ROHU_021925 [Labeo rohita]
MLRTQMRETGSATNTEQHPTSQERLKYRHSSIPQSQNWISAALSILPSVHLLIRSTGSSGNVQTLLSWPSGSPYTTACRPDPGIQTRCLTEGINHPCTTGQDALSPPDLEWVPVPSATADTGVSM